MQLLLGMNGHQVTTVRHGGVALDHLARHRADLLVTDLMTPEVGGLELIRQIRETPGLADIPIVAVSPCGQRNLAAAVAMGANEGISKPLDFDRRLKAVSRLIASA